MGNNWLYLINLLKSISISKKLVCHLKNKNKIFNKLSEEKSFQFQNSKENLILIICYIGTKLKE